MTAMPWYVRTITEPSRLRRKPTPPFRTATRAGAASTSTGANAWTPGVTDTQSQPRSRRTTTGCRSALPGASGGRRKTWVSAASRMAWPPPVLSVARTDGLVRRPSPSRSSSRRSATVHLRSPFLKNSALPVRVTMVAGSSEGWAWAVATPTRSAATTAAPPHARRTMTPLSWLAPRPLGRALFEEGLDALSGVVGQRDQRNHLTQVPERGAIVHPGHRRRGLLCQAQRRRGKARERSSQGVHRGRQLGPRHEPAHQPHLVGFARAHLLAREDHEHGALASHASEDGRHHDERQQPDLDLRQPEHGVIGGDDDVAAGRQAAAAGQREAVYLGDDRRLHAGNGLENSRESPEGLARLERRPAVPDSFQISARAEGLVARAGQHDDARSGIGLERHQRLLELADQDGIERVADLGPVQGHGRDPVLRVDEERLVAHAASSVPSTMSRNCFRIRAVAPQMTSSIDTSKKCTWCSSPPRSHSSVRKIAGSRRVRSGTSITRSISRPSGRNATCRVTIPTTGVITN